MRHSSAALSALTAFVLGWGCGDDGTDGKNGGGASSGAPPGSTTPIPADDPNAIVPPAATCAPGGGGAAVGVPTLATTLGKGGGEGWLGSPAVVDLDGDGKPEIIAARGGHLFAWRADGSEVFDFDTGEDRIWAAPVVANFVTTDAKLEIAVAARDQAWILDAAGKPILGFPKQFGTSETRTLGAGDLDGDGALDVVVGVRSGDDVVNAYRSNGATVAGFPPRASGGSGCEGGQYWCVMAGVYDQNLAVGDLDGDGKHDVVLPMDNAYMSSFKGTGVAFDSNPFFEDRGKTAGVRFMVDYALAKQGFEDDGDVDLQAHFTNTPPAIADIDKDGTPEIVVVGSVQLARQDDTPEDRLKGVGLWVVHADYSRPAAWETPLQVPAYVMGLGDGFSRTLTGDPIAGASNLVGLTNQVTIADIDAKPGLEMIFAGYDGRIHAVAADKTELWSTPYAEDGRALTGGVVVGDLSGDGVPEIVFTTYSPDQGGGSLFVLAASGQELHKVKLPKRGSMAVPTLDDVKGDGSLSVVVSLKDEGEGVQVWDVAGAKKNCLLWRTGRANYLRNGWVR